LKFIRERRAGVKSANWETKRSTAVKAPVKQNNVRSSRMSAVGSVSGFKLVDPFFCFQLQFGGIPS
jgi:hypothetical protein